MSGRSGGRGRGEPAGGQRWGRRWPRLATGSLTVSKPPHPRAAGHADPPVRGSGGGNGGDVGGGSSSPSCEPSTSSRWTIRNMEVTGEWRVEGGGGRGGSDLRVEAVPPRGRGGWGGAVVAVEQDVPPPTPRGAGGPPNGRTLSGCSRCAVRESTCPVLRILLPQFFSRALSHTRLIHWLTRAAAPLLAARHVTVSLGGGQFNAI